MPSCFVEGYWAPRKPVLTAHGRECSSLFRIHGCPPAPRWRVPSPLSPPGSSELIEMALEAVLILGVFPLPLWHFSSSNHVSS